MQTAGASPLQLRLHEDRRTDAWPVSLHRAAIASWTGRDSAITERRLAELEAMGIPRPPSVPMLYPVADARVSTSTQMEVVGPSTTGEVEFVLLPAKDRLWVGVGSDHTDRATEARDPALSKRLCDKPIGADFWALDEIEGHWDELRLRSFITGKDGGRRPYQNGSVSAMLAPRVLMELWRRAEAAGTYLLFCGTLPTIGNVRPSDRFEFELEDPVLARTITMWRFLPLTFLLQAAAARPKCCSLASAMT